MADHVRSHRARFQVMGYGKDGIVLDTACEPEKAIKYAGPHANAEDVAHTLNQLSHKRVLDFGQAYHNVIKVP